jgi:hypothetical protein
MYVLACIPIYGDCGWGFRIDPASSQESTPESGLAVSIVEVSTRTQEPLYRPSKTLYPRETGGNHGHEAFNEKSYEKSVAWFRPFPFRQLRYLRRSRSEVVPGLGDEP